MRRLSVIATAQLFLPVLIAAPVHPAVGEEIQLERQHGLYMVPVRINGAIILPFFLDSGSTVVVIPSDVFSTLLRTGTVKDSDFVGTGIITLADGSEQSSELFILHEVKVGDHVISDVVANVAPVKGDPLLGQSFLAKLPAWAIDNQRHVLVLSNQVGPISRERTLGEQPAATIVSADGVMLEKTAIANWAISARERGRVFVGAKFFSGQFRAANQLLDQKTRNCLYKFVKSNSKAPFRRLCNVPDAERDAAAVYVLFLWEALNPR
jgi:hypothetical protein